jgi:hypothetical protein
MNGPSTNGMATRGGVTGDLAVDGAAEGGATDGRGTDCETSDGKTADGRVHSARSRRVSYADLARAPARWPVNEPPRLTTIISTEEEFDWSRPFDRSSTSVRAARHLHRGQALFDSLGIRPTYVVDYPIATGPESVPVLREIHSQGRCVLGAHLHPWVSPPHEEAVTPRHSFPGNLPPELERRKIAMLCDAIEDSFGARPRIYQAGRYGFGPSTAAMLEELGFEVDASASPGFDFRSEDGPDYTDLAPRPFWFGERRPMLALPVTGDFVGSWSRSGRRLYQRLHGPSLRWAHLPALFARAGVLERLRLSPEGFSFDDLVRLTRALLARGERVFVFTLHSPSLMPGCTPYVRDERELDAFLATCRRYYEYFLGELGGRHVTPLELRDELLERSPPRR